MSRRAVIVVCDSLRADMLSPAATPHLCALREAGLEFTRARGVFPSTTRTSAASMATGCLPAQHGLLGNTMVLDEGQGLTCFSVGAPDFFDRLRRATGRALRRPTLAERLAGHGGTAVYSNVSPGAAYAHDPEGHGHVYHRSGSYGPGRRPLAQGLEVKSGSEGDAHMTRRFCDEALAADGPALAVLWLSEPDHTAHREPLGSPAHLAAMAAADACVGQVVESVRALEAQGVEVLLIACSDHGMETVRRKIDLQALLLEAGLKAAPDSGDVVVAPNGSAALLYFAPETRDRIEATARWLREQDFCGQVFQGAGLAEVGLPQDGALGLALALRCTEEANAFGIRGLSDTVLSPFSSESRVGHAQHGGLGPHEQRPFLLLHGAGLPAGRRDAAASLIDIAPTVLHHLGRLDAAVPAMQGRVLH